MTIRAILVFLVLIAVQSCGTTNVKKNYFELYKAGGEFHKIQELPESTERKILKQCSKVIKKLEKGTGYKSRLEDFTISYSENETHYQIKFMPIKGRGDIEYCFLTSKRELRVVLLYEAIICSFEIE